MIAFRPVSLIRDGIDSSKLVHAHRSSRSVSPFERKVGYVLQEKKRNI
jgi:hypothetical protein